MLGLGNNLQVVASLSIAEIIVLCMAPFIILKNHIRMRRDGVWTFFVLGIMTSVGCAIASFANHTPLAFVIRGMAVTCIIPCTIAVAHWILSRDPQGFKFYLIGCAISVVACTFVFQQAVEVSMLAGGETGSDAAADIMSGPLYWISRVKEFVMLPAKGWYLHCPIVYSALSPLAFAVFSMLTTVSGRSAALSAIASAGLVILGGRKMRTMKRLGRNFYLVMILAVVGVFLVKNLYSLSAMRGWLGEDARKKYESQTRGGTGILSLIMGGRMASFCGLLAAFDKPIVGWGPWAIDSGGYRAEFLRRFGLPEDYEAFERASAQREMYGGRVANMLPCHAYITQFWLWYGIFGLIFWLYILFVLFRYLKQDCWAVPQWYMWLAAAIPGYCWGIFFSPFGNRVATILFVVACLYVRAVRKGLERLPLEMVREIQKAEKK